MNKEFYEASARFFETPTREGLRDLLRTNVGELDQCDFKQEWPSLSKMARHILGFANSGGSVTVMGVTQENDGSLQPTGLNSMLDKGEVEDGIHKFIPNELQYVVLNFSYEESEYPSIKGKKFQVVLVEDNPTHMPFVSLSDGDGIRMDEVYVRRGTKTLKANHDELQRLINRRIETGHSSSRELSLQGHIEQLRILYGQIERYSFRGLFESLVENFSPEVLFGRQRVKNPNYPEEDFEQFVTRMIEGKKRLIEKDLGILE